MIVELILNVVIKIFNLLLITDIPSLPEEVHSFIETAFSYITAGAGILANYTPLSYLLVLFGVLLAVDAGLMVYHFVMWIVKKIPMIGVS